MSNKCDCGLGDGKYLHRKECASLRYGDQTLRKRIENELQISFDVCESIDEELLSFVAIKMTRNKEGVILPTVVVMCDDTVPQASRQKVSDELWKLAHEMRANLNEVPHAAVSSEIKTDGML